MNIMKQLLRQSRKRIMAALLLSVLLLSGCSLDAAPDVTVHTGNIQVTQAATEPPENTETTGDIVESLPSESWTDNAVRALLPEPPGTISSYLDDGLTAWVDDTTTAEMRRYCQKLLNAGFDQYYAWEDYYSDEGPEFLLWCRNAEGLVVRIDTYTSSPSGAFAPIQEFMITDYRPEEGATEFKSWGTDEFQQLLPDPCAGDYQTEMMSYSYKNQSGQYYQVWLDKSARYEACKAYAQKLRTAGFVYKETVRDDPFMDWYTFCAENKDGYMVIAEYTRSECATIRLYEPGMMSLYRLWENDNNRVYLPEPQCIRWSQRNTDYTSAWARTFQLVGMDYEGAKAYAQALKDRGYIYSAAEDDPENQTFVFRASGPIGAEGRERKRWYVRLIFDPSQVLEDGTPYCTLEMDESASW